MPIAGWSSPVCIPVGHRRQTAICVSCVERFRLQHWSERVDAFLQRSKRCGFCPPDLSRFDELPEDADSTLFHKVTTMTVVMSCISFYRHFRRPHRTIVCVIELISSACRTTHTGRIIDCNFLIRSVLVQGCLLIRFNSYSTHSPLHFILWICVTL